MSSLKVSVCQVNELQPGAMQQFTVKGRDILLARRGDDFLATAAFCSHYGAPLAKGVMCGDRIVCPWHNACFSLSSGTQLEPPGRDNLVNYPVHIEADTVYVELSVSKIPDEGNVFVELPASNEDHVAPSFAQFNPERDDRTFVIVGAGAAGNAAAEMLRKEGFEGHIIMLTADSELPYDRTALSKAYLQKEAVEEPDLLRSTAFYKQHGIEVKTSTRVSHIDTQTKRLVSEDDTALKYDVVLIATGGKVGQLPMEGADKSNVFTLRRAADAKQILEAAQTAKRAVIVGGGLIGMEVASGLRQQGLDVTVVASGAVPFAKVLGQDVGKLFQQIHEAEGVQFKLDTKAKAFQGNGKVESVELDTAETIPADMVVVGIGVEPATDFTGDLTVDDRDQSVIVNEYLKAAPDVFAAGDIAKFPYFTTGELVRIEHWRLAMQHGRVAAQNMLGKSVPFQSVPFFWTGQFGQKLRYVGHAEQWDDVIIQGSLADKSFLAFYVQDGQVMAVAGIGRDRDVAAISELMRLRQMPSASDLASHSGDWVKSLKLACR